MSFGERLKELESLGVEIARARHRIGALEIARVEVLSDGMNLNRDNVAQGIDRKILSERLDLHLAETRRDVLWLELSYLVADRQSDALLGLPDVEDV